MGSTLQHLVPIAADVQCSCCKQEMLPHLLGWLCMIGCSSVGETFSSAGLHTPALPPSLPQVLSMPKVSSEELLPCLESVLSFPREGGSAACTQEERQGLAEVGIDPQREEAVERAVQETDGGGAGPQGRRYQA